MKELFKVKDLTFYEEDFQDNIDDFEDIIPLIQSLQEEMNLNYEKITCVDINDCCNVSKDNYLVEIQGYINSEDEFITKEEVEKYNLDREQLDLFVIRIYKCVDCGKWIIDILE